MPETNEKNPHALITGGSAGIGLELSRLFARDGYDLILVSRPAAELESGRKTLLSRFPETSVLTMQKDLSVQGAAREVYGQVRQMGIEIDVLVNNAGFGTFGFMNDIPMEKELSMINLNVVSLFSLTRLFLADMVQRDHGRILNVSSVAGLGPIPHFTTYAATKAFSLNFSEALNYELKRKGSRVRVTTLCPPPVKTGFQGASGMGGSGLFDKPFTMDAEDVARAAYQALDKEESLVIPNRTLNFLMSAGRLLPKSLRMRANMDMIQ